MMPALPILPLVALLATVEAYCPVDYVPWFDGNCFKTYSFVSSAEGQTHCDSDGALLTSVHSAQENAWMATLMGWNNAWLGLACNPATGRLQWLDGTTVDYSASSNGTACSAGNGYLLMKDGSWRESPPHTRATAICKHKRKSMSRCDYNFEEILNSSTCASFYDNYKTTWDNAEKQCENAFSHLISIHDQQTNDAILARARDLGLTDGIHIGLQSNATRNQMTWSDGSTVDYQHFARGFPNDIFGHCTVMETSEDGSGGQWISSQCASIRLPFVCARPANDLSTTQEPPVCPEHPHFTMSGEIFSPSYPVGSTANLNCEYFLEAAEGKRVELYFHDFESNLCCDHLDIFEGASGNELIHSMSGNDPLRGHTFKTSTNTMRLKWSPTDGVGVRGWHATFLSI